MATQKVRPDPNALGGQHHGQQRHVARRKAVFLVLGAALVIGGAAFGIGTRGSDDAPPAGSSVSPAPTSTGAQEQTLSIVDVRSGTETATLKVPSSASEFDVSLDGSMVAYTDLDENGDAQVFVMDVDGSNARQLTSGEGGVSVADHTGPFWSPDRSMIAYARDTSDGTQLFVVRVSNREATMVTHGPERVVGPGGWAPDGGSILFSFPNYPIDHYSALSVDLATGESTMIERHASSPTPSPDGALIAFNSWVKPPLVRLIVANADGSERRVIARLEGEDGYQRWSPDSTQIGYVESTPDGSGFATYVFDLGTGERRRLTAGRIESWVDDHHILVS